MGAKHERIQRKQNYSILFYSTLESVGKGKAMGIFGKKNETEMTKNVKVLREMLAKIGFNFATNSVNNDVGADTTVKSIKTHVYIDPNRIRVFVGLDAPSRAYFNDAVKRGVAVETTANCVKSKESAFDFTGESKDAVFANVCEVIKAYVDTSEDTKKPESKKASRAKKAEKTA